MAESFSPEVATRLIKENPGRSSKEIAKDALDRGIIGSRGHNPLAGQGGALVKMYLEGRLPEVRRDDQSRPYRYYPKDSAIAATVTRSIDSISFRPTVRQEEVLTALVETRKFANRSEAVTWLIDQGISANRQNLDKIIQAYRAIENLRHQAPQLVA